MRILISAIVIFGLFVIAGCGGGEEKKRIEEEAAACPPYPVENGLRIVKMKEDGGDGEITLRLPEYVNVIRVLDAAGICTHAQSLTLYFTWFEGRLLPGKGARAEIPEGKFMSVDLAISQVLKAGKLPRRQPWNYSPMYPHKVYPLDYYPRLRLDDPDHPSKQSVLANNTWGVRGTRHHNFGSEPFEVFCSIKQAEDPSHPETIAENLLSTNGDSKCEGPIMLEKNQFNLRIGVRMYANAVPEIDKIYDAVFEVMQSILRE